MELCPCPECGLPAEVVTDTVLGGQGVAAQGVGAQGVAAQLVGVRCIDRHWFFGLRERLVA